MITVYGEWRVENEYDHWIDTWCKYYVLSDSMANREARELHDRLFPVPFPTKCLEAKRAIGDWSDMRITKYYLRNNLGRE